MSILRHAMRYIGYYGTTSDAYGRLIAEGIGDYTRARGNVRAILMNRASVPPPVRIAGIIAKNVYNPLDIEYCTRLTSNVVLVSNVAPKTRFPCLHTDDRMVGEIAARYYLRKNFRSLAFLGPRQGISAMDRWMGFRAVANAAGVEPHIFDVPVGAACVPPDLRKLPRPVGILLFNDRLAREFLHLAWAMRISVPHDFSVLGVDDDPLESAISPIDLSSIALRTREMGRQACQMLEDPPARKLRENASFTPILMPPLHLVERESTDTTAVSDSIVSKALRILREDLANPPDVAHLARETGVSRRTLERRFREALNRSVREEKVMIQMDHAAPLLVGGKVPIQEIARQCGFRDYRAFLREFQAWAGCAPSAYRRQATSGIQAIR